MIVLRVFGIIALASATYGFACFFTHWLIVCRLRHSKDAIETFLACLLWPVGLPAICGVLLARWLTTKRYKTQPDEPPEGEGPYR